MNELANQLGYRYVCAHRRVGLQLLEFNPYTHWHIKTHKNIWEYNR